MRRFQGGLSRRQISFGIMETSSYQLFLVSLNVFLFGYFCDQSTIVNTETPNMKSMIKREPLTAAVFLSLSS